jgi:hypothetical protein
MIAPIGYEAVRRLAQELGRPASTLTVLAFDGDPFVCGSPRHVACAEWFAAMWRQHITPRRPPEASALPPGQPAVAHRHGERRSLREHHALLDDPEARRQVGALPRSD